MEEIKILKNIELADPVMIAGWPGMGSVALGVVDYLRRKLRAEKFAEIRLDPMVAIDSVVVEDGVASLPPGPKSTLYYTKNPNLIILEGEVQLTGPSGIAHLNKVLDLAVKLKVKTIYTGAAFPLPISHREDPDVYGAVNIGSLTGLLTKFDIKVMSGPSHISGLNGLILGLARERGISAVCLLATMPQYAISLPNPKASGAIIETLEKILNFVVSLEEMDDYIRDMDEKMSSIEDKVKDVMPIDDKHMHSPPADKKVPGYILEKIEKLFREARLEKSKATELKRELDRWDLFIFYEDRFLDLFKDSQ